MKQPEDEIRLRSVLVCSIRNLCIWHSLSDMPVGVPVVTAGFRFGAQTELQPGSRNQNPAARLDR